MEWAMTQNNLGTAWSESAIGDRGENLRHAIECYEAALEVRTRERCPIEWAMTQNNLGAAYKNLPTSDDTSNLVRAMECYQASLQVFTREQYPKWFSETKHNIAILLLFSNFPLPEKDRLRKALECLDEACSILNENDRIYSVIFTLRKRIRMALGQE